MIRALTKLALLVLWFAFLLGIAAARELYPGQYADVDPAVREWFNSQKVPGTDRSCCNEADGAYAEGDIINGRWWARWRIEGALTAWMPVPPEAVLPRANRNGSPVVWYGYQDGKVFVRCFAPGGGV